MSKILTPISPELALVDPDLAAEARTLLPGPPDCLAAWPPTQVRLLVPESEAPLPPERGETPHRVSRTWLRTAITAGAWIVLVGIVAAPLLAFLPPSGAPTVDERSTPPPPAARKGSEAPVADSRIRWRATPGAQFYNLILKRGAQRVDLWPATPSARITRPENSGQPLTPFVTYSWFVYPAFRVSAGKFRYGAVVANGSITLRAGTLRSGSGPGRRTRVPTTRE